MNFAELFKLNNLTPKKFSRECGLSTGTISELLKGKAPLYRSIYLIEAAFDCAIWSTPEQFSDRQKLRQLFGIEPAIVPSGALRKLATKLKISYGKIGTRDALIAAIGAALEAKANAPKPKPITQEDLDRWEVIRQQIDKSPNWRCLRCKGHFEVSPEADSPPVKCPLCRSGKIYADVDYQQLHAQMQSGKS